ncbi:Mss4-like protein [Dendryphion nanum]|uniref:Mss4-like protein n=1 Tax=Dendryphion nanum TaxID=256645 RepID=A0A9P9D6X4_9PLEO|nr:Mss4-like protein [Dendryphion nanum]
MPTEGRCNCGRINVTVTAPLEQTVLCYCSNCRRSSAGLCSVNYAIGKSELEIEDKEGVLKSYLDNDTTSGNPIIRQFCGNCGSPIVSLLGEDAPMVFLKGGLFNQTPAPIMEVFKQDKVDWVKIPLLDKE